MTEQDKELRELAEKASTAFQVYRGYSVVDEYKGYVADKKTTRQLAKIFIDAEKKLQQAANPARIIELLDRVEKLEKLEQSVRLYLKNINSPLCIGWDMMLDALQELKRESQ